MAREEINFIRPQEVYDVGDNKSKVRYRGYNGKEHELQLAENLASDVEQVVNNDFVPNESGDVVFTDSNNNEHELITAEGFGDALNEALPSALADAQVIKTTWSELKALRDGGQLVAGSLYRITDYNCTTTQQNTRSAGHQFDIVLLALSANKLAEEGWAMMHDNIYDVTFADGVTKKCWLYQTSEDQYNLVVVETLLGYSEVGDVELEINENAKTITTAYYASTDLTEENLTYNYFQNSNLSAWKVWYCLDNDTARFAWADDSVDENSPASIEWSNMPNSTLLRFPNGDIVEDGTTYFAWASEGSKDANTWTRTEQPHIGDDAYEEGKNGLEVWGSVDSFTPATEGTGLPNGRGVIYRLIDEFNNDVAYDFKNIQFVRPLTDGEYDDSGTDTWVYTFNGWDYDNSISFDTSIIFDVDNGYITENNKIENVEGTVLPESISNWSLSNNVVLLGGSYTYISGSINCTSIGGVRLIGCNEIVVYTNTMFINCQNETFNIDDPAIYINNKKVLTET